MCVCSGLDVRWTENLFFFSLQYVLCCVHTMHIFVSQSLHAFFSPPKGVNQQPNVYLMHTLAHCHGQVRTKSKMTALSGCLEIFQPAWLVVFSYPLIILKFKFSQQQHERNINRCWQPMCWKPCIFLNTFVSGCFSRMCMTVWVEWECLSVARATLYALFRYLGFSGVELMTLWCLASHACPALTHTRAANR